MRGLADIGQPALAIQKVNATRRAAQSQSPAPVSRAYQGACCLLFVFCIKRLALSDRREPFIGSVYRLMSIIVFALAGIQLRRLLS